MQIATENEVMHMDIDQGGEGTGIQNGWITNHLVNTFYNKKRRQAIYEGRRVIWQKVYSVQGMILMCSVCCAASHCR